MKISVRDDGERRFKRAPTLDIMLGERSQRLDGVFYDDLRHLRARDFASAELPSHPHLAVSQSLL